MFEAYKIGVRISLINHASVGLMALSKSFLKTEADANKLQARILSIQKLALKGALTASLGAAGLSLFKGPLEAAKAYQNQLSNLNVLGMKQAEIAEVIRQAWQVSRQAVTTTAADNIKAYHELRSAFGAGHERAALSVLPQVQMAAGILEAVSGKRQAHVGFDMVKAIELGTKGAISTNAIQRQAERMTQAIVGMGGTVTVADFHQALKYARTAAPYLSEEFKYQYLPTLIQEMKTGRGGASGAGNTIATLYGMIAGRMIPRDLMQNWVDAGLVNPGMMVANKQHTGTAKILPGGIKGSALFAENPLTWANEYAAPAIQKLMATKHLSEVDAYYALTKNRIAAFGLQTLVNKAQQFERDRKLIEQADGVAAYRKLIKTNPHLAGVALSKQWTNLKAQMGLTLLPEVLEGMRKLTDGLKVFNAWAEKNTGAVKGLSVALAVLSGALAVRGTVWLLVAAFRSLGGTLLLQAIGGWAGIKRLGGALVYLGRIIGGSLLIGLRLATGAVLRLGWVLLTTPVGWMTLAIAGIAAGVYFIWKNWRTIKPMLTTFWEGIKTKWHTFIQWLDHLKTTFSQAGKDLINGLIDGIHSKWSALKGTVIETGGKIKSWFTHHLGIQSPSRVFIVYGRNLVEGAAVGIRQGAPLLRRAVAGLAGMTLAASGARATSAQGGSPYVAPRTASLVQVHSVVKLDERALVKAVTYHQAREMSGPSSAAPTFDPTMSAPHPALNTAW